MIEAKFHFFQIAYEVPRADAMIFQQAFFQVAPEAFDAVDRGGHAHIFLLTMVDPMMGFKRLIQLVIAFPGVAVNGGFQGDFPFDDRLQRLLRDIGDRFHIHDPIRAFINTKNRLLQLLRAPTTLDLAGFSQMLPHRPAAVPKRGAIVGLIHFHFTIQQVDHLIFIGHKSVPEPMKKAMHLLIVHTQPVGNRMIRQLQFEPVQQLVQGRPRQGRPRDPGIGPQGELFVASRTLPAIVAQCPQFSSLATLGTARAIAELGCTPDPVNLRATHIGCKNLFHMELYTSFELHET